MSSPTVGCITRSRISLNNNRSWPHVAKFKLHVSVQYAASEDSGNRGYPLLELVMALSEFDIALTPHTDNELCQEQYLRSFELITVTPQISLRPERQVGVHHCVKKHQRSPRQHTATGVPFTLAADSKFDKVHGFKPLAREDLEEFLITHGYKFAPRISSSTRSMSYFDALVLVIAFREHIQEREVKGEIRMYLRNEAVKIKLNGIYGLSCLKPADMTNVAVPSRMNDRVAPSYCLLKFSVCTPARELVFAPNDASNELWNSLEPVVKRLLKGRDGIVPLIVYEQLCAPQIVEFRNREEGRPFVSHC